MEPDQEQQQKQTHEQEEVVGAGQADVAAVVDQPASSEAPVKYAGFWVRFLSFLLDSILLTMVTIPILLVFYDMNQLMFSPETLGMGYYLISYGLPFIACIVFWKYRSATPGTIWMELIVVDADTLGKPSNGRLVVRYIGYYLSSLLILLGFVWIAFDSRKQGLHDKLANTLVIYKPQSEEVEIDV